MQDLYLTLPGGTIIRDRYVIEGLLGKGGFGSVYLVKDKRVKGNLFALKEVIDPNKQERERFTFECEVLRRLDHPSLPHVYRVFSEDVTFRAYMLMDYIEGSNLEVLRQKQPQMRLPISQVLSIMAPIIEAIAYLHSQHPPIIHRDIKPANIIVPTTGDQAMLVDFGIAKEYEPDSTTTSVRRCSPGYGAPEQYSSGTNTRTDIYGLAATCYALLTGIIPADAFYRMMELGSKKDDPLEPVNSLVPDIPAPVSDAIQKAMSINTNDRFATVEEFWQALNDSSTQIPETLIHGWEPVTLSAMASSSSVTDEAEAAEATTLSRPSVLAATDASRDAETKPPPSHETNDEGAITITDPKTFPQPTPALNTASRETPHSKKTSIFPGKRLSVIFGLILLALFMSVVIRVTFWPYFVQQTPGVVSRQQTASAMATLTQTSHHTPIVTRDVTPTVTSTPILNVPYLTGTYQGTLINTITHESSHMIVVIHQIHGQATYSGQLTLSSALGGSNPFTGTADAHNNFSFTVQSGAGQTPLYFYGTVQPGGFLQGNYCNSTTNQCNGNTGYFNVGPRY